MPFSRPGNLDILISGLSRVCTNPAYSTVLAHNGRLTQCVRWSQCNTAAAKHTDRRHVILIQCRHFHTGGIITLHTRHMYCMMFSIICTSIVMSSCSNTQQLIPKTTCHKWKIASMNSAYKLMHNSHSHTAPLSHTKTNKYLFQMQSFHILYGTAQMCLGKISHGLKYHYNNNDIITITSIIIIASSF